MTFRFYWIGMVANDASPDDSFFKWENWFYSYSEWNNEENLKITTQQLIEHDFAIYQCICLLS